MLVDDTQLSHSESPDNHSDPVRSLQDCVKDIGLWIVVNKLKLNNEKQNKTKNEAIRFSTPSSVNITLQLPHTITISDTDIGFYEIVRHIGFITDSNRLGKQHIIKTCKAAYIEIGRISSVLQYLAEDATLVSSRILFLSLVEENTLNLLSNCTGSP